MADRASNSLVDLISCYSKAELKKMQKTLLVSTSDIASTVLTAQRADCPLSHLSIFRDFVPQGLPDASEWNSEPLEMGKPIPRSLKKMLNMLEERNRTMAHFFWLKEKLECWWLLHFDMRDMKLRGNHWAEGPHVHLLSWITHPGANPTKFIDELKFAQKPKLPHSLHFRLESD